MTPSALLRSVVDANACRLLAPAPGQCATTTRPHDPRGAPMTPSHEDVIVEAGRKYAAPLRPPGRREPPVGRAREDSGHRRTTFTAPLPAARRSGDYGRPDSSTPPCSAGD